MKVVYPLPLLIASPLWLPGLLPFLSSEITHLNCCFPIRFSNIPELTIRGLHNVAESYLDSAKVCRRPTTIGRLVGSLNPIFSPQGLLNPVLHIPSMETLHAVMLLAWAEYKNGKHPSASSVRHSRAENLIIRIQVSVATLTTPCKWPRISASLTVNPSCKYPTLSVVVGRLLGQTFFSCIPCWLLPVRNCYTLV